MQISLQPQPTHKSDPLDNQSLDARRGEEDKFWFRSERFFSVDNQWYFTTREGVEVGPFGNRETAEHALSLFIDCIANQGTSLEHAVSIAQKGNWGLVGFQ